MRKFVIASVILFTGILSSHAQVDSDMVMWGVKAGANFATITGSDFDSPDSRTGFHAGLVAEVPFSERFSVQPELYYSQQGFKIGENKAGKASYHLDYIHVPVLAKFFLVRGFNIHAGPQIGFNVNDEISYDTDFGSGDFDNKNSDIKDIDFSILAGVEYKFDVGVFLNARYNYGFTELTKNSDAKNSVFQVGVGYMF